MPSDLDFIHILTLKKGNICVTYCRVVSNAFKFIDMAPDRNNVICDTTHTTDVSYVRIKQNGTFITTERAGADILI